MAAPTDNDDPWVIDLPVVRGGRRKVPAATGCSMMDWHRLAATKKMPVQRMISAEEVRMHNRLEDMWMVINGKVYDVTLFARHHPGGEGVLLTCAGRDATVMYNKYHPWVQAESMMGAFCVGTYSKTAEFDAPPPYIFQRAVKPRIPWEPGQPLTKEIVATRKTREELWVILNNKVYDVTKWAATHPGGVQILLQWGGKDATKAFEKYHSQATVEKAEEFCIGELGAATTPVPAAPAAAATEAPPSSPPPPAQFGELSLAVRSFEKVNHNSFRVVADAPAGQPITVPLGGHVRLYNDAGDVRRYTPVGDGSALEFIIKEYPKGAVSPHLARAKPGDVWRADAPGVSDWTYDEADKTYVLVAGGTGITPFIPLLKQLADREEVTVWLVWANRTPEDVLVDLEAAPYWRPERMHLQHHFSDAAAAAAASPPSNHVYQKVSDQHLHTFLPPPDHETVALVCGPPAFNRDLGGVLLAMGFLKMIGLE